MSPDKNSDLFIIMRQLHEKYTFTYPTIWKGKILEMTAKERYNLLMKIKYNE